MNPRTLVQIVLALLASSNVITDSEAKDLLDKANNSFNGQVLDELSIEQMIDLINNPEPPTPPSIFDVPDKPKIIT